MRESEIGVRAAGGYRVQILSSPGIRGDRMIWCLSLAKIASKHSTSFARSFQILHFQESFEKSRGTKDSERFSGPSRSQIVCTQREESDPLGGEKISVHSDKTKKRRSRQ